jgi:chromosome segregation ATPase
MSVLEQRVGSLVERHRETRKSVEELSAALEERELRLAELSREVAEHEQQRARLRERVLKLAAQVEEFEKAQPGDTAE